MALRGFLNTKFSRKRIFALRTFILTVAVVSLSKLQYKPSTGNRLHVLEHQFRVVINECTEAFTVHNVRTRQSDTLFSAVDGLFIIGLHFCQFSVSSGAQTFCVKGAVVDECIASRLPRLSTGSHGYAVSLTHAAIIVKAEYLSLTRYMVVEDDIFFDTDFARSQVSNESTSFKRLLATKEWNLIRLSYRPYFLETAFAHMNAHGGKLKLSKFQCPKECLCSTRSEIGPEFCLLSDDGPNFCDLRGSDFYILNQRSGVGILKALLNVDVSERVIDFFVLQRANVKQWLATYPYSTQTSLDTSVQLQRGFMSEFSSKCLIKVS